MKTCYFLFICLSILACNTPVKKGKQKKEIDPKVLITCTGIGEVQLSDTYQSLVAKLGKSPYSEHENTVYGNYTTFFENDPKQVNVYWNETKAPFKTIKFIEVNTPGSVYMTKDSVKVGLTLRDLVKLNGFMPVTFKNIYALDGGGIIKTFNSGDIEDTTPCLGGVLEQVKVNVVHIDEIKAFRKKDWIESSDPLLNRISMELSAIRISAKQ